MTRMEIKSASPALALFLVIVSVVGNFLGATYKTVTDRWSVYERTFWENDGLLNKMKGTAIDE